MEVRVLQGDDGAALEAFVLPRVESSMFLLCNWRQQRAGGGDPRHAGVFVAAIEGGQIVSLAGLFAFYQNLILQTPVHAADVVRAAVAVSDVAPKGIIGPAGQVDAARRALGWPVDGPDVQKDHREGLYRLNLADLIVPAALGNAAVRARRLTHADLDLAAQWRVAYSLEEMGADDTAELRARCRRDMQASCEASGGPACTSGATWLLEADGRVVSLSSFNSAVDEAVQVGGVYTPPERRGRGYGRCVVAASLLEARDAGAQQSILFTNEANAPAIRAYQALGYRLIGDYRLLIMKRAMEPLVP